MQLTKGTLFANQFRLLELKGHGGYGEVWLAHDELHNMEVAIKIFIALDNQGIEVFKSEYSHALELEHPNLLRAYQLGFLDNNPYLVMPYCPDSAAILIGKVNEPTLWRFIYDVASGLAYLHEKGIVHNNIKPNNVLINRQDHFVITDYGFSQGLHDILEHNLERKSSSVAAGTPAYKAPELFESQGSAVYATDIWALGASLYEMASGEVPFYGMGGVALNHGGKISRPQWPYSDNLIDTILQCLAKETWNRPWAKDLAERAKNALAGYSNTGNSVESHKEETPIHDNNHVEESSAYDILHDPQQNEPQKQGTSTKKGTVKVLGLVLAALLLGAVGFLGWRLAQVKSAKTNDNLMFQNCKTGSDYRAYMKKYPNGVNFELAKNRLEEWVNDSINQADTLKLVEPEQVDPVSETPASKADDKKKDIKEESKTGKTIDVVKGTSDKTYDKEGAANDKTNHQENLEQRKPENQASMDMLNNKQQAPALQTQGNSQLTPSPNQRTGLTQAGGESGLTSNEPLRSTGGLNQTQAPPSSEEEAYQRATAPNATLEDCLYWLDNYGDEKPQKWNEVKTKFWQLYTRKLQNCKTVQDCERFINEHDIIMRRARLAGSDGDIRMRKSAEDKKKKLESK